jgi:hypothetical protein
MAVAGEAEQGHTLLEAADRQPGFAAGRIDSGFEDGGDVVDEEPARLDQQANGKRIAAIERKKTIEIDFPRLWQARMVDDVLVGEARRPADQAFDLSLLRRRPRYRWNDSTDGPKGERRNLFQPRRPLSVYKISIEHTFFPRTGPASPSKDRRVEERSRLGREQRNELLSHPTRLYRRRR